MLAPRGAIFLLERIYFCMVVYLIWGGLLLLGGGSIVTGRDLLLRQGSIDAGCLEICC